MPHIARRAAASIDASPAGYATQSGSIRVCERSAVAVVSPLHLFGFCFVERLASGSISHFVTQLLEFVDDLPQHAVTV